MEKEIEYITNRIEYCSLIQRKCILQLIINHNSNINITEGSDGSRLLLEEVPHDLLIKIYNYIRIFTTN